MSKINQGWHKILETEEIRNSLLENDYVYITANKIKELSGGAEPRLMAKFDTLESRPDIFKKERLSIFSVNNGEYIVFRDIESKTYYNFTRQETNSIPFIPRLDLNNFDTYPEGLLSTESQVIDFAYISSLLQHFTGEERLYLTLRGRGRSGAFKYSIPSIDHTVNVNGVQIEIDAGFESESSIYLIEAKIGKRDNFHIRQLYYPYMEWKRKTKKRIVPLFITYSNGIFTLSEISFNESFSDLTELKTASYIMEDSPKLIIDLPLLLDKTKEECENITFPQANDLDKVIDIITNFNNEINTKSEIASFFDFEERQADYYANAAVYLGFAKKMPKGFFLTDAGKYFITISSRNERTRLLIVQLLKKPCFRKLISLFIKSGFDLRLMSSEKVVEIISKNTELSGTTPARRASTALKWLEWIQNNCELSYQQLSLF